MRDFETQLRRYDGTTIWVRDSARAIPGGGGSVLYYEGVLEDITERKNAEDTLRKVNEALRKIIQATPLAIISLDTAGNVESWNEAATRIFGWSESEAVGHPIRVVPEDRQSEFRELHARVLRGDSLAEAALKLERRDGKLIEAAIWAKPLSDAAAAKDRGANGGRRRH